METGRRDLGEFGAGLLQETAALRDALRVLPYSLGHDDPDQQDAAEAKQAADARADLVRRVIASRVGREEELSWEVDDDKEAEQEGRRQGADELGHRQGGEEEKEALTGGNSVETSQRIGDVAEVASSGVSEEHVYELKEDGVAARLDDRVLVEGNAAELIASRKEGGVPEEEEDVGWDEIEDLADYHDGEKVRSSGDGLDRIDLRKRLSAAEEDEDLSWDIEEEEDDDPIHP